MLCPHLGMGLSIQRDGICCSRPLLSRPHRHRRRLPRSLLAWRQRGGRCSGHVCGMGFLRRLLLCTRQLLLEVFTPDPGG
jgi:hypothetical protein